MKKLFVEAQLFTKQWNELGLTDNDLLELQTFILNNPSAGDIIQGTGGAIKIRFAFHGKGKRSGIRIIYVDIVKRERIYFLLCYAKANQEDLTEEQKKQIKALTQQLKGE